jgi:hypothetical protein
MTPLTGWKANARRQNNSSYQGLGEEEEEGAVAYWVLSFCFG